MLINTFQHLKGISPKKELALWKSGILDWKGYELMQSKNELPLYPNMEHEQKSSILHESKKALLEGDAEFFATKLPRREYYRIVLGYPKETLFLDIETTGLSRYYDIITLVGWSLDNKYDFMIRGDDDGPFRKAISSAKAIVTFNGTLFDIPFLLHEFKGLHIPLSHLDLRFFAKRVGLSGGQKAIEQNLGVKRPENLSRIKSENAPLLWYKYCWGDESALELLVLYNKADVEGMGIILDRVLEAHFKKTEMPTSTNNIYRFGLNGNHIPESDEIRDHVNTIKHTRKAEDVLSIGARDLLQSVPGSNLRIIGIDLTGSEARPSGWCLLDNNNAITTCLSSDDEIIKETLKSKPNLISIDSPLSLPEGRTSVSDDDPERDRYGIMRRCERMLKKRGVNVYPSLIPSMQKLTARGIELATHFRSMGIPVIESYPGAAQDIMGIPRKRASLELLAKGLEYFGIQGHFTQSQATHDELDAITSAIVGLFFWCGRFEMLGNDAEEYLIIPDLKIDPHAWHNRIVVGLSGHIAAGKTTAGRFLESKGFYYARFSQVLEKILQDRDAKPSRHALQQLGDEINQKYGQRWLCRQIMKMLPGQGNIVIDGLRFPEDHAFLSEMFGPAFLHIHIKSYKSIRLDRYVSGRGCKDEFLQAESHSVESKVKKLSLLSSTVVYNVSNMQSFQKKLNEITLNRTNKRFP